MARLGPGRRGQSRSRERPAAERSQVRRASSEERSEALGASSAPPSGTGTARLIGGAVRSAAMEAHAVASSSHLNSEHGVHRVFVAPRCRWGGRCVDGGWLCDLRLWGQRGYGRLRPRQKRHFLPVQRWEEPRVNQLISLGSTCAVVFVCVTRTMQKRRQKKKRMLS